jgi:hypothetical protein
LSNSSLEICRKISDVNSPLTGRDGYEDVSLPLAWHWSNEESQQSCSGQFAVHWHREECRERVRLAGLPSQCTLDVPECKAGRLSEPYTQTWGTTCWTNQIVLSNWTRSVV